MASKQPPKKRKAAAKKAVSKRGVAPKKATPRKEKETPYNKPISRAERNRNRLIEDIEFYKSHEPTDFLKHTKGSKKNPRGVYFADLVWNGKRWEYPGDPDIHYGDIEYKFLTLNPNAVQKYDPVYKGRTPKGKKKLVGYRRAGHKEIVTEHYRRRVFGKYFKGERDIEGNPVELTPEVESMINNYYAAVDKWAKSRKHRSNDLVSSYKLLPSHRDMTDEEVLDDVEFQDLVDELEMFSQGQKAISEDDARIVLQASGLNTDKQSIKEMMNTLRLNYGSNPRYQEVLVLLGRRLPSDTNPVGDMYEKPHIKFEVKPYYDAMYGSTNYEGSEE